MNHHSSQNDPAQTAYVLGHSGRELARLERQAGFFGDMTREVLVRAGIGPGMRVLDIGCGVGDVTAIASELVGAEGSVLGIDISGDAIAIAEQRMRATGKPNVGFRVGPMEGFDEYDQFDAVVGRFILIHVADPAGFLRDLATRVRPGTVLAFAEMDLATAAAVPPLPLLQQTIDRVIEVYRRAGRRSEMGAALHGSFRAAGLSPGLAGFTRIASGAEEAGVVFVVESVRSLLPAMAMLQVATPEEVGIDTLAQRLVAEAAGGDHAIFYPRLVGAWASV